MDLSYVLTVFMLLGDDIFSDGLCGNDGICAGASPVARSRTENAPQLEHDNSISISHAIGRGCLSRDV